MARRKTAVLVAAVALVALAAPLVQSAPARLACAGRAYVTNWQTHTISVLDITSNEVIATMPIPHESIPVLGDAINPTIHPDGRRVFIANTTAGVVHVLDVETNRIVADIPAGGRHPSGLAFTPDGKQLVVTLLGGNIVTNGSVRVIDLATMKASAPIPVRPNPERIAISPDGSRAYVVNSESSLSVIDVDRAKLVTHVAMKGNAFNLVYAPDGKRVYAGLLRGRAVAVVDTATNRVVRYIDTGDSPTGVTFAAGYRSVYVTNGADGTIQQIDLASLKVTRTGRAGIRPGFLRTTGDGRFAYITRSLGVDVAVIDLRTMREIESVVTGNPSTIAICGSPSP